MPMSYELEGAIMSEQKGLVDVEYLRMTAHLLEHVKLRSYALMAIKYGHKVLDVGCGAGFDTVALTKLVGENGHVVGVDHDEEMVVVANRYAQESKVLSQVTHRHADANELPFRDNEFDSCRSERLFQHLKYPEKALSEMIRVTRPDGRVVVLDTDWGSVSVDTLEVDIERRLARFRAEHILSNGYAGRQLYRLFKNAHLDGVSVEAFPLVTTNYDIGRYITMMDKTEHEALVAGVISEDELQRFRASSECAREQGVIFGSVCMILAAGCKKI